ncbi:MAG: ferredoxin [Desulfotomaculum sp.]|nr:ferredoxin [Desulfotomaculum sp.]
MKAHVDQDLCISCGACIDICPEVFDWNEDDKAHAIVDEVPEGLEDQAREAADGCPTEAIKVDQE